jgi:MFS family permease
MLLAGGMLSFLLVQTAWQLLIPGLILGMAHAVVFPPTVAASTLSFPECCRGLGTMLILAAYDLGVLIGAPLAGGILRYSGRFGLPGYPTMFVTVAVLVGMISVVFAASLVKKLAAASNAAQADAQPIEDDLPAELDPIAPVAAASARCATR